MTHSADLVCLSHLRWNFVYQRPNHLMARFARERRVFFVEEPLFGADSPRWEIVERENGLSNVHLHLPDGLDEASVRDAQRALLDDVLDAHGVKAPLLWYYTPMALAFTRHIDAAATIYDCMDELSLFHGAPPELREHERELLSRAEVVFTGGHSLYESKRTQHPNVHAFPSSVDREHFAKCREGVADPEDQANIPRPRIGFFGVIDERLDRDLVDAVAAARPDWQFVLVGPVVKIAPESLPRRPNIHYLGGKSYKELPAYLGGWDVAMMPFARNDATRFISPTKTLEYLAAGRPVVSTSIRDVVRPYGEQGIVRIADEPSAFVKAIEACLKDSREACIERADRVLAATSWDRTFQRMASEIASIVSGGRRAHGAKTGAVATQATPTA